MAVPPFKGSWWVEPCDILAGPTPASHDYEETYRCLTKLVLDVGIRAFIDLRDPEDTFEGLPHVDYKELVCTLEKSIIVRKFPIKDGFALPPSELDVIVNSINDNVQHERPVYVHCHGGHGRTGLVVACWLVQQGMTWDEALAEVGRLRKEANSFLEHIRSPQTDEQDAAVLEYERWLEGRR